MRSSLFLPLVMLGLIASTGTVGCGFVFTHGPPQGHEQMDYFTCTESNTGPILDIVWGVGNVVGGIIAKSNPDDYDNSDLTLAAGLAWGAISGTSAAVGFNKTSKCRDAKQALAQRQAGSNVESQGAYIDMPRWAFTSWYSTGIALPRIGAVARQIP